MAQWLGHLVWDQGIGGSNPLIPIFPLIFNKGAAGVNRLNGEVSKRKGVHEVLKHRASAETESHAGDPEQSRQDAGRQIMRP